MDTNTSRSDELRCELRSALAEWGVEEATLSSDQSSLIQSGALDSVALFNLSMWIEGRVGRPIDPNSVDVARAWDSVDAIVSFVLAAGASATVEPAIRPTQAVPIASPAPEAGPVPKSLPSEVRLSLPSGYDVERLQTDRANDIAEVARLFGLLWSDDLGFNERLFRWKYLQGEGTPYVYLVRHGGRVVAMRAMAPTRWEAEGLSAPEPVMSADDFIVEEAHRNQGLFAVLQAAMVADLAALGHRFFLSMSALRVTRLQALAAGSRSVTIGPPIGLAGRWSSTLERAQTGVARLPGGWRIAGQLDKSELAARAFDHLDALPARDGVRVVDAPPVQAMAGLVARLPHDGRLRQLRDASMLSWRFATPLYAYRFVLVERDGRLVAYVALARALSKQGNRKRIVLADWAAEDSAALRSAISAAGEVSHYADLVGWADPVDPVWRSVTEGQGCVPFDVEQAQRGLPCLLLHSVSDDHAPIQLGRRDLLSQENWDLRPIYTAYG